MNANSLANQLGWCITTKDCLNNLNSELLFAKNRYENMVADLRSTGYMSDLLPMIENMSAEFGEDINALIKYIQDEHLAYIQIQADATASAINILIR
ncbi:MAG: hypothetical protein RLZZ422_2097 [Pseudomonadota bacterium]|jgi:hypothetical protein